MLTHFDRTGIIWNSTIGSDEKLILLCLNQFVDAEGTCFPSNAKIMDMTSLKESTFRRGLRNLEALGIIVSDPRFRSNKSQTTNERTINFEAISSTPTDPTPKTNKKSIDEGCQYDTGGGVNMEGGGCQYGTPINRSV